MDQADRAVQVLMEVFGVKRITFAPEHVTVHRDDGNQIIFRDSKDEMRGLGAKK